MVAVTISTFVLGGILSTFLYLARTGISLNQYNDMESQARSTFLTFGQDCRQASTATWLNSRTLQLTVNGATVTYTYTPASATFTRAQAGNSRVLASQITGFTFKAFDINSSELDVDHAPASAGVMVKMIQVDLDLTRQATTNVDSTQRLISARFVLRNKKVT